MEIHFGKFSTAIGVPGPVDLDHSVAEYKDGFLIVQNAQGKSYRSQDRGIDACISLANQYDANCSNGLARTTRS